MRRSEYRKFRIRGAERESEGTRASAATRARGPGARQVGVRRWRGSPTLVNNDFAAMHEVVQRRYRKLLEQGGPFPDLVLIDGGEGQLSAAYRALESLGLANLVAVGLAKKEELIFTRDRRRADRVLARPSGAAAAPAIRDEAHRFAVTFHRRRGAAGPALGAMRAASEPGRRCDREQSAAAGGVAVASCVFRERLNLHLLDCDALSCCSLARDAAHA